MSRLTLLVSALVALAAGALSAFGFAPESQWPAAVAGIAILIGLIGIAPRPRTAFLYGWLFGTGHFTFGLTWIATAFTFQAKMPPMLGWVAVVLLSMFLALYVGLAALVTRVIARDVIGRTLVFAAAWMLAEWLRGWVLSGFAWNPLGAAALSMNGLGQLASYIGALGLSGLVVLAGGSLWAIADPTRGLRGSLGQRSISALLGGGIAVTASLAAGLNTDTYYPQNPALVIIQPNIGQDIKYAPGADEAHLRTYLEMTNSALNGSNEARSDGSDSGPLDPVLGTDAAPAVDVAPPPAPASESIAAAPAERRPTIVLWPESAVFGLVEEDPALRARLASVLGPGDLLLFGGVAAVRNARGEVTALTNSLFVLDAKGNLHGRYDKAHLVPLGEYVPARALMEAIGLARLTPGDIDFQAGPGPRTLALPTMPAVGVQICYEIIFAGAVVDPANRPQWLANISNDAWFGPSGPPQHLAQTRLRAIEEGLPVARATPTGISAIIDAHGNVIAASRLGEASITTAPLPPALPPTLFAGMGHLASGIFGLLLLIVGVAVDRARRI